MGAFLRGAQTIAPLGIFLSYFGPRFWWCLVDAMQDLTLRSQVRFDSLFPWFYLEFPCFYLDFTLILP